MTNNIDRDNDVKTRPDKGVDLKRLVRQAQECGISLNLDQAQTVHNILLEHPHLTYIDIFNSFRPPLDLDRIKRVILH